VGSTHALPGLNRTSQPPATMRQGAVMAAVMAAMQRAGMALAGVPPLRFICVFGAAYSEHPRHQEAFLKGPVSRVLRLGCGRAVGGGDQPGRLLRL